MSFRLQSDGVNPVPFSNAPSTSPALGTTHGRRGSPTLAKSQYPHNDITTEGCPRAAGCGWERAWYRHRAGWPGSCSIRANWARALKPCMTWL
ncbi:hypothetical protein AMTRI_Chr11g99050 [Amborella trichopoda]